MRTKEDFLNEKSLIYYDKGSKNGEDTVEGAVSDVLSAMDEWAKEWNAGMLKWMKENRVDYSSAGFWFFEQPDAEYKYSDADAMTDAQLLDKYISESTNK